MKLEVDRAALATGASWGERLAQEKSPPSHPVGQSVLAPNPAALRYSVVVTTADNPKKLGECLRALLLQNIHRDEFEIIVVDLRPDTATFDVFDVCETSTGGYPRMRYFGARAKSLAEAKALGQREAHSAMAIHISDDALPARSWLQSSAIAAAATPQQVAIQGRANPQGRFAWLALAAGALLVLGGALGFAAAAFGRAEVHQTQASPVPGVEASGWIWVT